MKSDELPGGVYLELSDTQIDEVVRAAAGTANMTALMAGLTGVHELLEANPQDLEDPRLSRSLLAGLLILASVPLEGEISNMELAQLHGMNVSTSHRYASTLVAAGLIERDHVTRRYRLPKVPHAE
jgi:IclR helix-turn-helix domain